jgi:acetylglutamate/LysW-gamma-L-alpha-aminoadipate kinase
VCADVAALLAAGERVVLVHGGSAELERLAARLGVPQRTLTSRSGITSRYTDDATLEVLTLALAGQVKPALVAELGRRGVAAAGLTGLDAGLLRARRKQAIRARVEGRTVLVRDDRSGRVEEVGTDVLKVLLDSGITPVVSPPALAEDGRPVNVNADRAASAIAAALGARRLVFLTAAPGVLADHRDESTRLAVKLIAAREALVGGVPEVFVADGRVDRPVRRALEGRGTAVVLAPRPDRQARRDEPGRDASPRRPPGRAGGMGPHHQTSGQEAGERDE